MFLLFAENIDEYTKAGTKDNSRCSDVAFALEGMSE